jgi:hypothetical protein
VQGFPYRYVALDRVIGLRIGKTWRPATSPAWSFGRLRLRFFLKALFTLPALLQRRPSDSEPVDVCMDELRSRPPPLLLLLLLPLLLLLLLLLPPLPPLPLLSPSPLLPLPLPLLSPSCSVITDGGTNGSV